jgi:uncharacterized protein
MTQTWNDLLFAHWPLAAERIRTIVPPELDLDLYGGRAWIGIVPFSMTNVGPRGVPRLPGISAFAELNVRTYVRVGDRPGVHFLSLDAASRWAVRLARALLNLPYHHADMTVEARDGRVRYASRRIRAPRAEFLARYELAGEASVPLPGSLEHFLTERYCLYQRDRRGRAYRLEIHHPPWRLAAARAEILRNTMAAVHGLELPAEAPLLHFARRQDVVAWAPVRVG